MTASSLQRFSNLRDVNDGDTQRLRLVRCPACGVDLDGQPPAIHIRNEHTPADFGLGVADE